MSFIRLGKPFHVVSEFQLTSILKVWGIAIGGTILQNELRKTLPESFSSQFHGSVDIAYSAIPTIASISDILVRAEVQDAFGKSIAVIWKVMAGVVGIGLFAALLMNEVPMHEKVDAQWTDKEKVEGAV